MNHHIEKRKEKVGAMVSTSSKMNRQSTRFTTISDTRLEQWYKSKEEETEPYEYTNEDGFIIQCDEGPEYIKEGERWI